MLWGEVGKILSLQRGGKVGVREWAFLFASPNVRYRVPTLTYGLQHNVMRGSSSDGGGVARAMGGRECSKMLERDP